jgi:hypothetical protein
MEYLLRTKKKSAANYSNLDIFADTVINFGLDFYDVDNIDKIKVPISVSIDLPMNQNNLDIIGYDPSSSTNNTIPFDAFDFILSVNGIDVLSGDMFIEGYSYNNNTPIISIRIVDKIQEIFKNSSNLSFAEMYDDYDDTLEFDTFLGINEGSVGTIPSLDAIHFPYIDFANDINKFNYEARQFLQFGYDKNRAGITPAFSVREFISRFFSELNIGVTSRFFQLGNYNSAIQNVDPEYMYMVLPVRLRASSRTRTRGFYLVEGPYNFYINDYTADLTPQQTNVREVASWPETTASWNYNDVSNPSKAIGDFGVDVKYNQPNDYTDLTRAYYGSSTSYTGKPIAQSRQLPANSWIAVDIPMLRISQTNYSAIKDIDISNSNAEFVVKAILWVDGYPTEPFRMCNPDGSVKVLNIADANIVNSDGTDGMEVSTGTGFVNIHPSLADLKYQVRFNDAAVGDFIWEQKEYEILAGSVYGVSIEFEIISGNLRFEKVDTWNSVSGLMVPSTTSFVTAGSESIGKMIYREDLNNIGNLYLMIAGINGTFNPYFGDDDVNIYQSLRDNDIEVKPADVLKEIIKRFNLSVVFDQNSNSVLLDRLPDIREQNTTTDIQNILDDAEQIEVDIIYKTAKSIELKGLDSLHFDDFGYDTVTLNTAGSDELKFSLQSRFFNESLCGDPVDIIVPEGFDQYEIGLTTHDFTPINDVGITFAYIDRPNYKTNIKRGRFIDKNDFKGIVYDTYDSHTFDGRLVTSRNNSIKLYHFDDLGNQTDLYDFFVGNDNVVFYGKPKIRFKALFDKEYAYNIKDNYSIVTLPQVHCNGIIIKSVNGELYDTGVYSDVEGIIL